MNNRLIPILLILFVSPPVSAQSDTTASSQTSWFVSIHSGLLLAKPEIPSSVSVTMMPGVRLNRVALTVGTGYDTYSAWRMVPVFAGLGYDLIRRRNYALFVHCNAGYARAWHSNPESFAGSYRNEGGYFYHPFFGFRVNAGRIDLYFSAGYKFQNLTYEQVPIWSWGGIKTIMRNDMQRFSIQMGIGI